MADSNSCFSALKSALSHEVDLYWTPVTGSTNDDLKAKARAGSFERPYLLAAGRQTAGRGTRGRVWRRVGRQLSFSLGIPVGVALRALPPGLLSIAAALGTARALTQASKRSVYVKWPNDIWAEGGKAGGILLESVQDDAGRASLVIGVGLNLEVDEPGSTGSGWPIRAPDFLVNPQDPEMQGELLAMVVDQVLESFEKLEKCGAGWILKQWPLFDAFYGCEVLWRELDGEGSARGIDRGIDTDGHLVVERRGAPGCRILSGELASLSNN